ncbi:hypothetical protein A2U01_0045261 [Trifolium medium]|uniref:CCHC-type domain-containing protein n=1 Tax=Trifolium medium TaxID=97028 RepID=A0A392QIR4_9FABA|nr:hypothetical protein [Trifolium medium]
MQFAFDLEKPPGDRKKKGKEPFRKAKKKGLSNPGQHHYRKSRHKKTNAKPPDNTWKNSKKRKAKKLDITCHKCGKPGHYANQCRVKKALNEIEDINLRDQLEKILLISSDSENNNSAEEEIMSDSSESSMDETQDNNSCQCNELNYWKSIVEMNGLNVQTHSSSVI